MTKSALAAPSLSFTGSIHKKVFEEKNAFSTPKRAAAAQASYFANRLLRIDRALHPNESIRIAAVRTVELRRLKRCLHGNRTPFKRETTVQFNGATKVAGGIRKRGSSDVRFGPIAGMPETRWQAPPLTWNLRRHKAVTLATDV